MTLRPIAGTRPRGATRDADEAFAYLKATNSGRTPDDVLRMLSDGMTRIEPEIRELAEVSGAKVGIRANGGNYPFPGWQTFYTAVVQAEFDRAKLFPMVRTRASSGGPELF